MAEPIRQITTTTKKPSSAGYDPYDLLFTGTDSSDIFSELTFGEGSAAPTEGMQAEILLDAITSGDVDPKTLSPELKALVKDRLIAQGVSEADASKVVGDDTTTFYDMENALALGAAKEAGLDAGGPFGADLGSVLQQLQTGPVQPTPQEKLGSAVGTQTATFGTNEQLEQERQTLIDLIRQAGGNVGPAITEGIADFGNLVYQAITLGLDPEPLYAVIPNIMDIIRGGIGGKLVLGPSGSQQSTVLGTGRTGLGRGTKVALGGIFGRIANIFKQGGNLGTVIARFPTILIDNLPGVISAAASAGYAFTDDDKQTVVKAGLEPSILDAIDDDKTTTGGGDTVLPAITDSTTVTSADTDIVKVGGLGALGTDADIKVGGLGGLGTDADVKVGGLSALGTDADIKVGGLNLAGADTDQVKVGAEGLPEIKTPAITATDTTATAGGGGGGAGGFGTPTGGVETVSVEPGPLVDIPGFYDISSMSIIPDYIDELVERERRRQTRGAAEGGHVKKFEQGGMSYADYEQNILGNTSNTGNTGGNSSVRGKLSQFVGDNAGALLASAVGGLFGLLDNDEQQPSGYQGGIPDYTAQRSLLPGAFDQTGRRPGSMGRRYFTDVQYAPTGEGAVMQGVGLPAVAPAADTSTELDTEALASLVAAPAVTPAVTPAVISTGTTSTTTLADDTTTTDDTTTATDTTPFDITSVPADQDYTQEEVQNVVEAILAGDTNISAAANRFLEGDINQTVEEMLLSKYATPEQVANLVQVPTITKNGQPATTGDPALDMMIALIEGGTTTLEEGAYIYGIPFDQAEAVYEDVIKNRLQPIQAAAQGGMMQGQGYAAGGMASLDGMGQGYYLGGPTDGMADLVPATIDGNQPAALSDGEFVIPADVVSHLGNGNSEAGAQQLYSMMDRVRTERTGTTKQGPEINPTQMMPA